MPIRKTAIAAFIASGLVGVSGQAFAHSYYNLTGAGTVASGNSAVGFGIANSINGTDGVSNNSNGTNRVSDGTNGYNGTTNTNSLISGTGSPASSTEVSGNLPYMWYSGQHSTATGVTKRELYTGASATDTTGNLFNQASGGVANSKTLTLFDGTVVTAPGASSWGANNVSGLWKAYNDKNANASYGPIMADPASGEHPFLAVAGNSSSTGLGLDYGLIHISCGANTASTNCVSSNGVSTGDLLTTITVKQDSDYSQYTGLLDVALYRGVDQNTSSDRNAAASIGDANIQGSSLGTAIWSASMDSADDTLFYKFVFNQTEWDLTDSFYTLVIGAHGGEAINGVAYDVMVTTSPVPVPGAVWLFGSAMAGLIGFGRRKSA